MVPDPSSVATLSLNTTVLKIKCNMRVLHIGDPKVQHWMGAQPLRTDPACNLKN